MRLKLLPVVMILFIAGSIESRPQQTVPDPDETPWEAIVSKRPDSPETVLVDSSEKPTTPLRALKDLKDMDLSLRTVATQLLNVTDSDNKKPTQNNLKLITVSKPEKETENVTKFDKIINDDDAEPDIVDTSGMVYGRPLNSKFAYFGSSHPGEAMAMTEDELEKELSLLKVTTVQKTKPTTTGLLSTWVLLNPPSTTIKNPEDTEMPKDEKSETTTTTTTIKSSTENHQTTLSMAKISSTSTTMIPVKTTSQAAKKTSPSTTRKTTLASPVQTQKTPKPAQEKKTWATEQVATTPSLTTLTSSTKKKLENVTSKPATTTKKVTPRTTTKVKSTTPRTTSTTVQVSSSKTTNKPKNATRKTSPKPEVAKTEALYTSSIERVTYKPVQTLSTESVQVVSGDQPVFITKLKASVNSDAKKGNGTSAQVSGKLKSSPSKSSAAKKPVEEAVKVQVEPVKVHHVQELSKGVEKGVKQQDDEDLLSNAKIDLKFHFNPELTKVEVETSTPEASSTTSTSTKRSKRKKNKGRKRKPQHRSTTASPPDSDNAIQESKIEPETKVATANSTKNKKKPSSASNPISTTIYNFLSREVVPSFGVMSLVGLGLGIASYFLYPFGGSIARRNYVVSPNYKYNFEEYGGIQGQAEEDVLSKVYNGMTSHYKDQEKHFYRYQNHDADTTKKNEPGLSTVSSTKHRPLETGYEVNYRNTEFKYPDVTTTQNYYDAQKKVEYVNNVGSGNRQFVVGNVPKEYATSLPVDLENNASPMSFDDVEKMTSRVVDEGYEEITPAAVAVEHGPRAMKGLARRKRDTVIQMIPAKTEKEKEEDLSNEIFDIIDSALPGDTSVKTTSQRNEVESVEKKMQKKRQEQESGSTLSPEITTTMMMMSSEKITESAKEDGTMKPESDQNTSTESTSKKTPESTTDWFHDLEGSTKKADAAPTPDGFSIYNFVKKVAEIKVRLGLTILKHASEGFARYIGSVQKRINGDN